MRATILLTHNPQLAANLSAEQVQLVLAGHFHGGQIWMPFGLEFRIFRREPLGRQGYRRGLHRLNGFWIFLNRGIGSVLFPLRLGARPEIAILDLSDSPPANEEAPSTRQA